MHSPESTVDASGVENAGALFTRASAVMPFY